MGFNWTTERIVSVRKMSARYLQFSITRPQGFRFRPGQFGRLGLADSRGAVVWRPYSMVSGPADECLEFFSILVPDGAFSTLLEGAQPGGEMLLDPRAFGSFSPSRFQGGEVLWLLASGTGLAPFVSMLRADSLREQFRKVVVVHCVRAAADLAYAAEIAACATTPGNPNFGMDVRHLPVLSRERAPAALFGRLPLHFANGALEARAGDALAPESARVMVCGGDGFVREIQGLLYARGMKYCRDGDSGEVLVENGYR